MTIDMYGDKVAEASALIREFAKVDYFHYFARDPESSLEEFIAMLDQAEEKGRQEQAARIAELELQIVEVQAECIKRGADLLERQLAEASAPAVEQQPKPVAQMMCPACGKDRLKEPCPNHHDDCPMVADAHLLQPAEQNYLGGMNKPQQAEYLRYLRSKAAPQAADTDKVREALNRVNAYLDRKAIARGLDQESIHGFDVSPTGGFELTVTDLKTIIAAASMAAQAPVREVPEGWKLVPAEPTDAMLEAIEDAAKAECSIEWDSQLGGNLHFGDPSRVYADMLAAAPLPAAPVQPEGEKP